MAITLQTELTIDDVNLIESGACGAFVHGLEDEFMGNYCTFGNIVL